jgi:hypothetical protein
MVVLCVLLFKSGKLIVRLRFVESMGDRDFAGGLSSPRLIRLVTAVCSARVWRPGSRRTTAQHPRASGHGAEGHGGTHAIGAARTVSRCVDALAGGGCVLPLSPSRVGLEALDPRGEEA